MKFPKQYQAQEFIYLGSALTEVRKLDIEMRRRIGIARDAFQKIIKYQDTRKFHYKEKRSCQLWNIDSLI